MSDSAEEVFDALVQNSNTEREVKLVTGGYEIRGMLVEVEYDYDKFPPEIEGQLYVDKSENPSLNLPETLHFSDEDDNLMDKYNRVKLFSKEEFTAHHSNDIVPTDYGYIYNVRKPYEVSYEDIEEMNKLSKQIKGDVGNVITDEKLEEIQSNLSSIEEISNRLMGVKEKEFDGLDEFINYAEETQQ